MWNINGKIVERYQASAIDRRKKVPAHKREIATVYFLAANPDEAMEIGHQKLRQIGVKGNYFVDVDRYYPWRDSAFEIGGYIRKVEK